MCSNPTIQLLLTVSYKNANYAHLIIISIIIIISNINLRPCLCRCAGMPVLQVDFDWILKGFNYHVYALSNFSHISQLLAC